MALQGVRGEPPYSTVRALAGWAEHRKGYLRGRALLAGWRWDALSFRDQLDMIEAILGEGVGVDTILDDLHNRIAEAFPDPETWGRQPAAAKAEAGWGDPAPKREKPPTVAADEPVE